MKKVLVLILAILYISGASGATVNFHYCMGQFAGWEFGHGDDNECGSCGMEKKPGSNEKCCRDENKTIKLSDVHKSAEQFVILTVVPAETTHHYALYEPSLVTSAASLLPRINAPPVQKVRPVYLLTRSIRI